MPILYYIRHGETDWNAESRFQGQMDIPLNERGLGQADRNGLKLAELLDDPSQFDYVSSPLSRTRETMERIRLKLQLPKDQYRLEPRLMEISYGDFEGTTQADLKIRDRDLYYERKRNAWNFRPPNGESHQDAMTRISAWASEVDRDTVVVAHGAVGRVMRVLMAGVKPEEIARDMFPQNRICIFENGTERWV